VKYHTAGFLNCSLTAKHAVSYSTLFSLFTAGQASGKQNAVACIGWLMGAVMPLDELPNGNTKARISNEKIRALTRVHI
jgi:hypothetical protein